jgi:hypothetical protein
MRTEMQGIVAHHRQRGGVTRGWSPRLDVIPALAGRFTLPNERRYSKLSLVHEHAELLRNRLRRHSAAANGRHVDAVF